MLKKVHLRQNNSFILYTLFPVQSLYLVPRKHYVISSLQMEIKLHLESFMCIEIYPGLRLLYNNETRSYSNINTLSAWECGSELITAWESNGLWIFYTLFSSHHYLSCHYWKHGTTNVVENRPLQSCIILTLGVFLWYNRSEWLYRMSIYFIKSKSHALESIMAYYNKKQFKLNIYTLRERDVHI